MKADQTEAKGVKKGRGKEDRTKFLKKTNGSLFFFLRTLVETSHFFCFQYVLKQAKKSFRLVIRSFFANANFSAGALQS